MSRKKEKRGKLTASFLRRLFLESFPRFSDLHVLACSCLCFPLLPAEAAPIALHVSALLHAVGLALPPCPRRLAEALAQEETQPVSEHRGLTFKKHSVIEVGWIWGISSTLSVCFSPGTVQRAQFFSLPTSGCVWAMRVLSSAASIRIEM